MKQIASSGAELRDDPQARHGRQHALGHRLETDDHRFGARRLQERDEIVFGHV